MSDVRDDGQHERTAVACRRCGCTSVFVSAFTWAGERQLEWHCRTCTAAWVTPERRNTERRTPLGSRAEYSFATDRRSILRRTGDES
jgi:hypothetical protein